MCAKKSLTLHIDFNSELHVLNHFNLGFHVKIHHNSL